MAWYNIALRELASGKDIAIINRGSSMHGIITDGQKVVITPVNLNQLSIHDIVLVRIRKNRFVIHKIIASNDGRFLIGNNLGGTDCWVSRDAIYGALRQNSQKSDFDGLVLVDEYDI